MKKRIDEKIEKFCGVSSGCCACFCRETVFFIGWLVAVVSFCFSWLVVWFVRRGGWASSYSCS